MTKFQLTHPQSSDLNVMLVSEDHRHIGSFKRANGRGPWTFIAADGSDPRNGRQIDGWLTDEAVEAALS